MTEILPLAQQHCSDIAKLHMNFLSTNFKGAPGYHLLRAYYETISLQLGACGYVAQEKGQAIGYVCGVWDAARVRSYLFKNRWPILLLWGIAHAIISPAPQIILLTRLFNISMTLKPIGDGFELRPIVVALSARGTGLADKLVEVLSNDAANRGFKQIYLYAESDDIRANKFYARMGFLRRNELIHAGKPYTLYIRHMGMTQ